MIARYTRELMDQLEEHGCCLESVYRIGENTARQRIHNAARRLGVKVSTRVAAGAVIGTIVEDQ